MIQDTEVCNVKVNETQSIPCMFIELCVFSIMISMVGIAVAVLQLILHVP